LKRGHDKIFTLKKGYVKIFTFVAILAALSVILSIFREELEGVDKKWEEITPSNPTNAVSISTQRSKNTYFQISAKELLEMNITGPGFLRIITRLDFPEKQSNFAEYEVQLTTDQLERNIFKKKTRRSYISRYNNSVASMPGKIRNLSLFVPEGNHHLRLTLPPDADYLVNFRFFFTKEILKGVWAYLQPLTSPQESTLLVDKKRKRAYFIVLPDKGPVFEAVGPANLRVLTRWVNTQISVRFGRYQVKVWEDGVLKQTHPIEASPAKDAVLVENAKQGSVGTSQAIYIQVPEGKHRYEILADGLENVESVLARPFILKEDLTKETL